MREGLPANWLNISLKDVVVNGKGKKPKQLSKEKINGMVPYIDIKAFEKGIIEQYADIESSKIINEKDVLVVWDGARFGLTGFGMKGAAGSTLMVLTPVLVSSKYLYFFINRQYEYINTHPKGTGTPHVNPDIFWKLDFPLSPLNEQKRIAAKLDHIMPKIDAVKKRLEHIPKIIKRFRQSVLTAAVTGKLTEKWREEHPDVESAEVLLERIKEERTKIWKKKKIHLKDVCTPYIKRPKILPISWSFVSTEEILSEPMANGRSVIDGNGCPILRLTAIKNGFIDINERKKGEWGREDAEKFFIKKGDFLISRGNGSLQLVGRGGLVLNEPDEIAYPDTLIRLRVIRLILEEYLGIVWDSDIIRSQIETLAHTTAGIHKVSQKDIGKCGIPLPFLEEQREIVRQVDKLFAFADKLEAHYKKAKEKIDKLPQSVLAKAFRGELVPQDPKDEPAEKLLERIKQEKERLTATNPGKKRN